MINHSYLCKARVDKPVQAPSKDLVTHQDREVEVPDGKCTRKVPCIGPVTRDGEAEHDHVDGEGDSKEFTIRISLSTCTTSKR